MYAELLKPKNWLYLGLAVLLVVGLTKVYNGILDRGAAAQLKKDLVLIDAAKAAQKAAEDAKADYVAQYQQWLTQGQRDKATAEAIAKAERDRMQAELNTARQSLANKERTVNELQAKLDRDLASLRMPVLVVRLWNESLQGTATDPGLLGTALAGSTRRNDGDTTDVTLLELLEAGYRNNAQAVQRGVVLQQWREYYQRNSIVFAEHERALMSTTPKE